MELARSSLSIAITTSQKFCGLSGLGVLANKAVCSAEDEPVDATVPLEQLPHGGDEDE